MGLFETSLGYGSTNNESEPEPYPTKTESRKRRTSGPALSTDFRFIIYLIRLFTLQLTKMCVVCPPLFIRELFGEWGLGVVVGLWCIHTV